MMTCRYHILPRVWCTSCHRVSSSLSQQAVCELEEERMEEARLKVEQSRREAEETLQTEVAGSIIAACSLLVRGGL